MQPANISFMPQSPVPPLPEISTGMKLLGRLAVENPRKSRLFNFEHPENILSMDWGAYRLLGVVDWIAVSPVHSWNILSKTGVAAGVVVALNVTVVKAGQARNASV